MACERSVRAPRRGGHLSLDAVDQLARACIVRAGEERGSLGMSERSLVLLSAGVEESQSVLDLRIAGIQLRSTEEHRLGFGDPPELLERQGVVVAHARAAR